MVSEWVSKWACEWVGRRQAATAGADYSNYNYNDDGGIDGGGIYSSLFKAADMHMRYPKRACWVVLVVCVCACVCVFLLSPSNNNNNLPNDQPTNQSTKKPTERPIPADQVDECVLINKVS